MHHVWFLEAQFSTTHFLCIFAPAAPKRCACALSLGGATRSSIFDFWRPQFSTVHIFIYLAPSAPECFACALSLGGASNSIHVF